MLQDVHQVVDECLVEFARPPWSRRIGEPVFAVCLPSCQPSAHGDDIGIEQMCDAGAGAAFGRQQHGMSALALAVRGALLVQVGQGTIVISRQRRDGFHGSVYPIKTAVYFCIGAYEQGKVEEALAEWHEALRIQPDYWEAQSRIGYAFGERARQSGRRADWLESVNAYRKVLTLTPSDAYLHACVGSIEWHLGYVTAAQKSLKAAIEIDPSLQIAYRELGGLQWELRQWRNVLSTARSIARLRSTNPDMQRADIMYLFRSLILPLVLIAAIIVFLQKDSKAA